MAKRKESVWSLRAQEYAIPQPAHSDGLPTFTSNGIEVDAWYDIYIAIGSTTLISWSEVDQRRAQITMRRKKEE